MASMGFEFAYMIDGSNATPMIRDWDMAADTAGYKQGDLLVIDTAGRADKAAATATKAFAICQETETSTVSAGDDLKVAFLTRGQCWKCSMDATTTALVKVYNTDVDVVDENTVDADGGTTGCMMLLDTATDDDGNVLAYVVFSNTDLHGNTTS